MRKIFKGREFVFAGKSSADYGLYIADFGSKKHSANSFGNVAELVETRLANRVTPLHYGVRYHDSPLSFSLIFSADRELNRYEMQEIACWLTGYEQYQWLSIVQDDMADVQFRCLVRELTPIHVGWRVYGFEAEFVCDCPYGYSSPFSYTATVSGSGALDVVNRSTARVSLRPMLTIRTSGTDFLIRNDATGAEFALTGMPTGEKTITVDGENEVVSEKTHGYNLYAYFNFSFPELTPGTNPLHITGSGDLVLTGRYLLNVGA